MALTGKARDAFYAAADSDIIRIAHHVDAGTGAVGTPRTQAVTYATVMDDPVALGRTFDKNLGYGIYRHEAWTKLEQILAHLEHGGDAITTASGRSAIDLVLKLLPKDSHIIVAPGDIYLGTRALFEDLHAVTGLEFTYADSTEDALEGARRPNTRLIFTEPLTNPQLKVSDLSVIAAFAKKHGILSVSDNAVSPLLVQPLDHGIDLVLQCLTKYISGSNSHMGGAIIVNQDRPELAQKLRVWRNREGAILDPDVAATMIELAVDFPGRMKVHSDNGQRVAEFLAGRPEVAKVNYPGLRSHPDHALAQLQFADFGGLLSFELTGGRPEVERFMAGVERSPQPIILADSFGAPITLLNYYAVQSAMLRDMDPVRRSREFGITDSFIRVSVGRGAAERIISGLELGLNATHVPAERTLG